MDDQVDALLADVERVRRDEDLWLTLNGCSSEIGASSNGWPDDR